VLIVVGIVAVVFAVIYLTITAPNLPGFVPGHVGHVKHARHYTKRGIASIVVAVAAFAGVYYNDFRHN
jgi:hypothetical protein